MKSVKSNNIDKNWTPAQPLPESGALPSSWVIPGNGTEFLEYPLKLSRNDNDRLGKYMAEKHGLSWSE
jgi:hypothetical protein